MTTPQSSVRKICCRCKADVSQIKRVKDDQGRYYCHPCWTQQQKPPTSRSSSPSKQRPQASTPEMSALYDLADAESSAPAKLILCGICGALCDPTRLRHDKGLKMCDDCAEKRQAKRQSATQQPDDPDIAPGTKRCPYCAEIIQARAIKCRFCGMDVEAVINVASSPKPGPGHIQPGMADSESPVRCSRCHVMVPRIRLTNMRGALICGDCYSKQANKTNPFAPLIKMLVGVCVLMLIGFGIYSFISDVGGGSESSQSASSRAEIASDMSFVDFEAQFGQFSRLTSLQKEEAFKAIKGKLVRWKGIVSHVDEGSFIGVVLGIQHMATTQTYDVQVEFSKSDLSTLRTLNTGEMVEYEGTVDSYGGAILPHGLKQGRIISHRQISDHDRFMLVGTMQKDAMTKARGEEGGAEP